MKYFSFSFQCTGTFPLQHNLVGVDYDEGPPVPISNTVVKLVCADNTWLETAREDKLTPTLLLSSVGRARGC